MVAPSVPGCLKATSLAAFTLANTLHFLAAGGPMVAPSVPGSFECSSRAATNTNNPPFLCCRRADGGAQRAVLPAGPRGAAQPQLQVGPPLHVCRLYSCYLMYSCIQLFPDVS